MLRRLGYDVPAPILTQYNWPGPLPPFDVQRKTCALITLHQRAYVLNDMGTGKTATALWAWDYLRGNSLAGKLLVVAPLSSLSNVWVREAFKLLPGVKTAVLHGTKEKRLERLASDASIYIINHDGVKVIQKELMERTDIDTLVLDELAIYRNGQTPRSKNMRALAARMKWAWGMTGSPTPNSPTDAWAQCKILTPNTVPKFFSHFRDQLMIRKDQYTWAPKPNAVELAYAAMQPAVRYKLEDVVELPEKIHRTVDIPLGPLQAKAYREIVGKLPTLIANKTVTAANAGVEMSKLLQISMGWVYANDGTTLVSDGQARVDALIDAIEASDRKVLVFVPFKHALAGISAALTKAGIEHATLSGDTPLSERNDIFYLFQNTPKYQTIVAHPACCHHSITLTTAATTIWYAPVTSLDVYDQANARIRRVGQQFKQLYLHFQATPVERKIYRLLHDKQSVQNKLLELFEQASE